MPENKRGGGRRSCWQVHVVVHVHFFLEEGEEEKRGRTDLEEGKGKAVASGFILGGSRFLFTCCFDVLLHVRAHVHVQEHYCSPRVFVGLWVGVSKWQIIVCASRWVSGGGDEKLPS